MRVTQDIRLKVIAGAKLCARGGIIKSRHEAESYTGRRTKAASHEASHVCLESVQRR
ncbi:hypothetical protein HO133_001322 [Letharia lupina]|uniref:Uncharacterized protein n=1 Tax=Letharia lupina TaxID=560253 RepID=A0A8H6CFE6_9LECA|nr:uncharacterized protein HO133_001322 [Letharia lupina]KAF6222236.1 hypothetical protein HO133_001322 [Letharia lupina]